jgi:hypothetical protein
LSCLIATTDCTYFFFKVVLIVLISAKIFKPAIYFCICNPQELAVVFPH